MIKLENHTDESFDKFSRRRKSIFWSSLAKVPFTDKVPFSIDENLQSQNSCRQCFYTVKTLLRSHGVLFFNPFVEEESLLEVSHLEFVQRRGSIGGWALNGRWGLNSGNTVYRISCIVPRGFIFNPLLKGGLLEGGLYCEVGGGDLIEVIRYNRPYFAVGHNTMDRPSDIVVLEPSEVILHEEMVQMPDGGIPRDDIALLRLAHPLDYSLTVQPLCMPRTDFVESDKCTWAIATEAQLAGQTARAEVVGYGLTQAPPQQQGQADTRVPPAVAHRGPMRFMCPQVTA